MVFERRISLVSEEEWTEATEMGSEIDEVEDRAKGWMLWLFDVVNIVECMGRTAAVAVAFGELVWKRK